MVSRWEDLSTRKACCILQSKFLNCLEEIKSDIFLLALAHRIFHCAVSESWRLFDFGYVWMAILHYPRQGWKYRWASPVYLQSLDTDEMNRMRSIMFAVIVDIQSRWKNLAQRLFWLASSTIGISYPSFTSTTSKVIDRSYLPTGSLHKAPEYMNLPKFDPGQHSLFKIHTHVTAQGFIINFDSSPTLSISFAS